MEEVLNKYTSVNENIFVSASFGGGTKPFINYLIDYLIIKTTKEKKGQEILSLDTK